jgi:hypothetical protein
MAATRMLEPTAAVSSTLYSTITQERGRSATEFLFTLRKRCSAKRKGLCCADGFAQKAAANSVNGRRLEGIHA